MSAITLSLLYVCPIGDEPCLEVEPHCATGLCLNAVDLRLLILREPLHSTPRANLANGLRLLSNGKQSSDSKLLLKKLPLYAGSVYKGEEVEL